MHKESEGVGGYSEFVIWIACDMQLPLSFFLKNPRAQKNQIGTPPPPPKKKKQNTPPP